MSKFSIHVQLISTKMSNWPKNICEYETQMACLHLRGLDWFIVYLHACTDISSLYKYKYLASVEKLQPNTAFGVDAKLLQTSPKCLSV